MDRTGIIILSVALVGAVAVHLYFGFSLGLALLIFFVGWPLIGTVVTIDDDVKGGWSNPDGTVPPPWLQAPFWGQILAGLALSSCGAAVDFGWHTESAIFFWAAAAVGFAISVPMIKKGFRRHAG